MHESETNPIRRLWDRVAHLPSGTWLFGVLVGRLAPYTGTIRPRVFELREGYARVAMNDRRAIRNHLDSIHAIALMNLGEFTTGIALMYGLPAHARAILTHLEIDYHKKARGRLFAEASAPHVAATEREELELKSVIRDVTGEVVAEATARWLVGPKTG